MSWLYTPLLESAIQESSGPIATLDVGTFSVNGQSVIPGVPSLIASVGSFSLSGQIANLGAPSLVAGEGLYTLTGQNATFTSALVADVGSFTLSGQAAVPGVPSLIAAAGTYTLTGQSANLNYIALGTGSFTLTGQDVGLSIVGSATLAPFGRYTQLATYWGTPEADGLGGETFATPVHIYVRWEARTELTYDLKGEQFVSNARVYAQQNLDIGGYLYLGESAASSPQGIKTAFKIRNFNVTRSLDGLRTERRAML